MEGAALPKHYRTRRLEEVMSGNICKEILIRIGFWLTLDDLVLSPARVKLFRFQTEVPGKIDGGGCGEEEEAEKSPS
ncbi:unnamed protein product [Allacma fusca]|uniref:Uncharacterized protein n=1 Tax=Allacma fusca TaxID=39272 RepID=A0A8J2NSI4_9HEXA|nr:unnamed protein product [Allacma fusca]